MTLHIQTQAWQHEFYPLDPHGRRIESFQLLSEIYAYVPPWETHMAKNFMNSFFVPSNFSIDWFIDWLISWILLPRALSSHILWFNWSTLYYHLDTFQNKAYSFFFNFLGTNSWMMYGTFFCSSFSIVLAFCPLA